MGELSSREPEEATLRRPLDGRPLPEGYYADNFAALLDHVVASYEDLLAEEIRFYDTWKSLSEPARRLFVRLISRKGPVFRRDRLRYDEIGDLGGPISELETAGFLDRAAGRPLSELLPLLLRHELVELAADLLPLPVPSAIRKTDLVLHVQELVADDPEASERWSRAVRSRYDFVRPLHDEEIAVFRLLFFGNLSQDWTEFVLRDLGVVRYETYDLDRELRLFPTRRALLDTYLLIRCRELCDLALHRGELRAALAIAEEVVQGADRWYSGTRRHQDRILNRIGREMERAGEIRKALDLYAAAVAPPARERRARILAREGRIDDALDLCAEIAAAPRDESEVVFAPRFAHRLRRQRGDALAPWRRPRRPRIDLTVEKRDHATVEDRVLEHLAAGGRQAFFAENWLWRSLFGLAFWDIIFTPVRGAFLHPFQYGPLDLDTPDFRRIRAEAIERRLDELRGVDDLAVHLRPVYEAKRDLANRLVAWQEELRPHLELAWRRVSGPHLARICDRLSRDLRRYRCGLPDLLVVRDGEPSFELWEIKAPGDQLRPEQGAWIDYLNEGDIPASVVHVRWAT